MKLLLKRAFAGWNDLPQLIRFLGLNAGIGILAGWLLLVLILATDVNGVGTLIATSEAPLVPIGMLMAGFAVTFGSAAAGAAVMMMAHDRDDS